MLLHYRKPAVAVQRSRPQGRVGHDATRKDASFTNGEKSIEMQRLRGVVRATFNTLLIDEYQFAKTVHGLVCVWAIHTGNIRIFSTETGMFFSGSGHRE